MDLSKSAALQARSIYALILRRIRSQYAGSRAGYAWAIIEPIVWVFVLKFAIRGGATGVAPIGTSYEVFFATGVVLARTWRTSVGQVSGVLTRNKREALPTLHRLDSALAAWVLEIVTSFVALAVILAMLGAFGYDSMPYDIVSCIIAVIVFAMYALTSAAILALLLTLMPALEHFKGIILLIGFFTSGFSFVVDRMPPSLKNIVTWNPLLHVIELFREGFYRGYECRSLDLIYLFMVISIGMLLGFAGERALRRHGAKDLSERSGGEELL